MKRERRDVVITVLAHFDASFVGASVRVAPSVELSRKTPEFTLTSGDELALGDPFLSRKPLSVRLDGSEVVLDGGGAPPIHVGGRRLDPERPQRISEEELDEGVVLELDDRVAVLLHRRVVLPRVAGASDMGLVGVSEGMERLRATVRKVAPTSLSVLICGESGSGKELVASAVHRESERSERNLEMLNMAAVTPSLAGSELFGHSRGAFTGAAKNHVGAFERADGGSLFLDEVGDTPQDIQPLLLRALETGEILPVGGSTHRAVDVRVIAATDVDLEAAIASGDFRTSLLHRLSGFRIDVPPLSARREDIGLLILHFLRQELERMGAMHCLDPDPHQSWLSATTIARMARYEWPGNVRQLRNVTRQMAILSCDESFFGEGVDLESLLPPPVDASAAPAPRDAWPSVSPLSDSPYRAPDEVNEDEMLRVLREHGWRLAPTAKTLGVSRTSLYAMIERSSKVRKAGDLTAPEIETELERADQDIAQAALALEVSEHALKIRMKALDIAH